MCSERESRINLSLLSIRLHFGIRPARCSRNTWKLDVNKAKESEVGQKEDYSEDLNYHAGNASIEVKDSQNENKDIKHTGKPGKHILHSICSNIQFSNALRISSITTT